MRYKDRNVEDKLIHAAKQEFLKHGFEKAALRKICAAANVTTGAMYFFFENKEELFCRTVSKTVKEMEELGRKIFAVEMNDYNTGVDQDIQLIKFLYQNRDELQLLIYKSQGTRYEMYKEQIFSQLVNSFLLFFQTYGKQNVDRDLIRIIVKMRWEGYMELINGGYDLKHAMELSKQIGIYADGGFKSLIAELKNKNSTKTKYKEV